MNLHGLLWPQNLPSGLVRLLAVVGFPLAFRQLQLGEGGPEGGILGTAGVHTETDAPAALPQVADPHLPEGDPVLRAFDAEIVLPAAVEDASKVKETDGVLLMHHRFLLLQGMLAGFTGTSY